MDIFPMLARFNEWANERIYGACAKLSDEDYKKDRRAFFGSIHNTLNHLLVVDRIKQPDVWTFGFMPFSHLGIPI